MAQLVSADLARSGRFNTTDRKDMIEQPHTGAAISFDDWRRLNNDYIVVGQVQTVDPDHFNITFELYNVLTRQRMLGYQISANKPGLRLASHQVADMVFQKILGIRGAFATRIAYISVLGSLPHRQYRLIVADADGENPHVVMQSNEPLMSPAWSPDGQSLAYVSFEDRLPSVYVQFLQTGERRRVSARAGVNQAPAWSPDGKKLALTLSTRDGNLDVYVLDLATQALTRITTDPGIDTEPQWSKDGQSIYFTSDRAGGPQIYRVGIHSGDKPQSSDLSRQLQRAAPGVAGRIAAGFRHPGRRRTIASRPWIFAGAAMSKCSPRVVSTCRRAMRRMARRSFTRPATSGRGVLALVSADGRVQERLVSSEGELQEPAWAPF